MMNDECLRNKLVLNLVRDRRRRFNVASREVEADLKEVSQ
jgi:hypothetical protein